MEKSRLYEYETKEVFINPDDLFLNETFLEKYGKSGSKEFLHCKLGTKR